MDIEFKRQLSDVNGHISDHHKTWNFLINGWLYGHYSSYGMFLLFLEHGFFSALFFGFTIVFLFALSETRKTEKALMDMWLNLRNDIYQSAKECE